MPASDTPLTSKALLVSVGHILADSEPSSASPDGESPSTTFTGMLRQAINGTNPPGPVVYRTGMTPDDDSPLERIWGLAMDRIRELSRTTWILLRNGTVGGDYKNSRITIVMPTASMARRLNDDRNSAIINQALHSVSQSDWEVQAVTTDVRVLDSDDEVLECGCEDKSFGAFMRKVEVETNAKAQEGSDGPPFGASESIAGEPGTGIGTAVTDKYHDHNSLDPINVLSRMQIKTVESLSPRHPHHVNLEAWLEPEGYAVLAKFLDHIQGGGNALWPMSDGTWV